MVLTLLVFVGQSFASINAHCEMPMNQPMQLFAKQSAQMSEPMSQSEMADCEHMKMTSSIKNSSADMNSQSNSNDDCCDQTCHCLTQVSTSSLFLTQPIGLLNARQSAVKIALQVQNQPKTPIHSLYRPPIFI